MVRGFRGSCPKCRRTYMRLDPITGVCAECAKRAATGGENTSGRRKAEERLAQRIGGSCGTCKFSVKADRLRCHRWPPKPIQRGMARVLIGDIAEASIRWEFPTVEDYSACGEFAPRE